MEPKEMDGTSSETNDANLTQLDHLKQSVFGNNLIFGKIASYLRHEDLKSLRLQNKMLNENVLQFTDFVKENRFVVKWRTLQDEVLKNLSFPIRCMDLHVFRGAPNDDAISSAEFFVSDQETRLRDYYVTWFQIWDENSEILKDFYTVCRDVHKLRIFGAMSINVYFGGIESKMIFFPSVPQVLASISELKELHIMGNFDAKGLFGHDVDNYDQKQLIKLLEPIQTFKFKGHDTVLPEWIFGMKNLTDMCISTSNSEDFMMEEDSTMMEEDSTIVPAVKLYGTAFSYCTFIFDMFRKLSSLVIANKNSLRQLHLDPVEMLQTLFNHGVMLDLWGSDFPALTHFSYTFVTELVSREETFVARLLKQLETLTLSQRLTSTEIQNVPVFPTKFLAEIQEECPLRELRLVTRAPLTIQKVCYIGTDFDAKFPLFGRLRFFPQLKLLNLDFFAYTVDMSTIFRYLPESIEELYISRYHKDDAKPMSCTRSDGSPMPIIRTFPNMKIVKLGNFVISENASAYNYLSIREVDQVEGRAAIAGEEEDMN